MVSLRKGHKREGTKTDCFLAKRLRHLAKNASGSHGRALGMPDEKIVSVVTCLLLGRQLLTLYMHHNVQAASTS